MIQPNNTSTTSYNPNCKDLTPSTSNTQKLRQTTFDSNKPDKKTVRRHPQNRNRTLSSFSSFISTKSQRSTRSQSYWKRNHLPWVLAPLARRTIQATQSITSV